MVELDRVVGVIDIFYGGDDIIEFVVIVICIGMDGVVNGFWNV